MSLSRTSSTAGVALVLAMACASWAWHDCLLLAAGVVLAYRLFLLRMERGAPWRALTAAVETLTAGVLASGAGIALTAGAAAAWLGWWHPTAVHSAASMWMPIAAAVLCCLARPSREEAAKELGLWLWLLGGGFVAIRVQDSGVSLAPCLLVAAVGMAMLWVGWHLATETTSALLRAGSESR